MAKIFTLIVLTIFTIYAKAQNVIDINDLYIDEVNLVYTRSNDSLFSGICERRRKNGHLVFEEFYEKGVIQSANYYYNGKKKIVSDSAVYNTLKPFEYKTIYRFNLESQLCKKESFDNDGKSILEEEFKDGKIVYSCEYDGKKKHGREFCYSKEGEPLEFEYVNGKKVREKD